MPVKRFTIVLSSENLHRSVFDQGCPDTVRCCAFFAGKCTDNENALLQFVDGRFTPHELENVASVIAEHAEKTGVRDRSVKVVQKRFAYPDQLCVRLKEFIDLTALKDNRDFLEERVHATVSAPYPGAQDGRLNNSGIDLILWGIRDEFFPFRLDPVVSVTKFIHGSPLSRLFSKDLSGVKYVLCNHSKSGRMYYYDKVKHKLS